MDMKFGLSLWKRSFSAMPRRIDELLDPAAVPDGIVESVACFPVYQPLDDDLQTYPSVSGRLAD
jgi:hypothetical protein